MDPIKACPDENFISEHPQLLQIYDRWHHVAKVVMQIILALVLVMEVSFYFLLDFVGLLMDSLPVYAALYVIRPTIFNLIIYFCWSLAIRHTRDYSKKAHYTLLSFTLLISCIMVVHYVFTALYGLMLVPLFMSVIYGVEKVTRQTLLMTMIIYPVDMLLIMAGGNLPDRFWFNMSIGYAVIPLGYILVRALVRAEAEKLRLTQLEITDNARLREEVYFDELTGIRNHAGIVKYMDSALPLAESGMPLYMSVIDIDYFKNVNDDFGHLAGNEVLSGLGQILRGAEENGHMTVARYGGEEFAIIFLGVDMEEAQRRLTQIHDCFGQTVFQGVSRHVTFSAGLAGYHAGDTAGDLFRRADAALYRAKNAGRNQIVVV